MILSVILLSVLMILLSFLSVIRFLVCDNNQKWLQNLNLIYKTLWTGAGMYAFMYALIFLCFFFLKLHALQWLFNLAWSESQLKNSVVTALAVFSVFTSENSFLGSVLYCFKDLFFTQVPINKYQLRFHIAQVTQEFLFISSILFL